MPELDLRRLRPQTQTVSVYTRHSSGCSKAGEPQWRRCKCAKYLYLLKDGKRRTVSAKTRSWEKAEEIREAWDPVQQKMRELEEQKQAQLAQEVSIEVAVERWLKSICTDIENKYTQRKYETTARRSSPGFNRRTWFCFLKLRPTRWTSGRPTGVGKRSVRMIVWERPQLVATSRR